VRATVTIDSGVRAEDATLEALAQARLGDPDAFRVLFRALQPRLLRYLQVLVGTDAEDVASETWLQIVRDLHTFKGDIIDFRRWVTTIGRHRAFDHMRRASRRPSVDPYDGTPILAAWPDHADAATLAIQNLTTNACLKLIARLPLDQAEAVTLRVVVGLDTRSAAAVLGKTEGAVRSAAHRGLKRLAQLLYPTDVRPTEPTLVR
jgi:RNA polymerase sigma-70 factor, ECF subfamily